MIGLQRLITLIDIEALQSMVIFKQPEIGGAGNQFWIMSVTLTNSFVYQFLNTSIRESLVDAS